jgi:hypothetical protein
MTSWKSQVVPSHYAVQRKNTSRKVKKRIPEEMRAEVILVIHWDRTHGVGIDTSLIHKSRRKKSGKGRTREVQTRELIIVVGRERNVDRRSGPK